MRTVDHKTLAYIIINHYMTDVPEKYCNAFYIGCIEPDYNPFSYFHGFLKSYTLYGHNFHNVKGFLEKVFERLNCSKKHKRLFFYRLGLLVHYVTDAFTHAHTAQFSGTLREHAVYEQQLHLTFEKLIDGNTLQFSSNLLPCRGMDEVSRIHKIYSKKKISVYNDLIFIFSIIGSIMENFRKSINYNNKLNVSENENKF